MSEKIFPCRFTIQFNPGDPQQQRAIELLNAQGRRKAVFITNALLYYISEGHQKPLPDAEEAVNILLIEDVVNRILAKRDALGVDPSTSVESSTKTKPARVPPKPKSTTITQDDIGTDIPADLFASITNAVDGFRL